MTKSMTGTTLVWRPIRIQGRVATIWLWSLWVSLTVVQKRDGTSGLKIGSRINMAIRHQTRLQGFILRVGWNPSEYEKRPMRRGRRGKIKKTEGRQRCWRAGTKSSGNAVCDRMRVRDCTWVTMDSRMLDIGSLIGYTADWIRSWRSKSPSHSRIQTWSCNTLLFLNIR